MKAMNEQELRTLLQTNGVEVSDALNIAEIEKIVLSCHSDEEAVEKLCQNYPHINKEWLTKMFADSRAQAVAFASKKEDSMSEDLTDLEDDALEEVAGGSVGSWFKKNWPTILTVVAVCGVTAAGAYALRGSGTSAAAGTAAAGAGEGAAAGGTAAGETAAGGGTAAAAKSPTSGMGFAAAMFGTSVLPSILSEL